MPKKQILIDGENCPTECTRYIDGVFTAEISNIKDLIKDINKNMSAFEKRIELLQMRVYYVFGIATTIIVGFDLFLKLWWK